MQIKPKTLVLIVSLTLNALVIFALVAAAASKSSAASLSFPVPQDGYAAAAAVVIYPASAALIFNPVEIALKPTQKAFLQYSVVSGGRQTNVFVSALYDPQIIAIEYDEPGISITALREGETIMQYIANDGIKNLAHITVTK